MASIHKTVLLSKNVLAVTTKTMGQVLEECGRCGFGAWILYVAAYTNARSVDGTKSSVSANISTAFVFHAYSS